MQLRNIKGGLKLVGRNIKNVSLNLKRPKLSTALTFVFLLVAYVLLLQFGTKVFATSDAITGKVTNSYSAAVGGALVYATAPGSSTMLYGPSTTDGNGNYTLWIPIAGTYDFHFLPPNNKGYGPIVQSNVVVSGNQTLNAQFSTQTHTLSGTLTDNTGKAMPYISIYLEGGNHQTATDANGNYTITVPAGVYSLKVTGSVTGITSFNLNQQDSSAINLLNSNMILNLQLQLATITVTAHKDNGVAGGVVGSAFAYSGTTSLYPGDPGTTVTSLNSDTSNPNVITTIVGAVYAGSGLGTSASSSMCEYSGSTADCLMLPYTVTGNASIDLPQASPATRTYSGTLTDGSGSPLPNVRVTLLYGSDSTTSQITDSNGNFTIYAMPKKYYLQVSSNGLTENMQSFTLTQSSTNPTIDLTGNSITQNLQMSTTNINATAYDANGIPAYNTYVQGQTTSGTTTLYSGDPGESMNILSSFTTTSTNNVGSLGTIDGAVYSALGLHVHNMSGSVCDQFNTEDECITSALTITGPVSINVPQ